MAKSKVDKRIKKRGLEPETLEEIYGIVLMSLALLTALFLFVATEGIGRYLVAGLEWAIGWGRFLVPFFLLFWGISFLARRKEIENTQVGIGLAIFFTSLVSLVHLSTPFERNFAPKFLFSYGGLWGAIFTYIFRTILGNVGAYIVFSAALIVGIILSTRVSLSNFISKVSNFLKKLLYSFRERRAPRIVKRETEGSTMTSEVLEKPEIFETQRLEEPAKFKSPTTQKTEGSQQLKMLNEKAISSEAYLLPPLDFLKRTTHAKSFNTKKGIKENIQTLEKTLRNFDVEATVERVIKGPTVTRFEVQLATGVKVGRVASLADDIALALASPDVRILSPIPGKSAVGIEVPNKYRELVTLGDVLSSEEAKREDGILVFGVGKDIAAQPVLANLDDMPHLLIAGATGSGKSVCINSIITSILMRARPTEVKMLLIDPKRIEFTIFGDIPHLTSPVIINTKQAAAALSWAVSEMEERFKLLAKAGAKNIATYNTLLERGRAKEEGLEKMPYLVIVIDELADLMMISPSEVEDTVCRLAQMARAVGIHLVVATQRPSADIITGLIKSNITSRIAFAVTSQTDSRVILDTGGAEKLVGKGDALFITAGTLKPRRIQGAFVTEQEITLITNFIKRQATPDYNQEVLSEKRIKKSHYDMFEDELLDDAMEIVVATGLASVSMLQRRLRIGYSRAARLIDILEEKGVVGPFEGSRPRAVLVTREEFEKIRGTKEHETAP